MLGSAPGVHLLDFPCERYSPASYGCLDALVASSPRRRSRGPSTHSCTPRYIAGGSGGVQPQGKASSMSAFSIRTFKSSDATDLSWSTRLRFLNFDHASRILRLISGVGSVSLLMEIPRNTTSCICLYFRIAASIFFACAA